MSNFEELDLQTFPLTAAESFKLPPPYLLILGTQPYLNDLEKKFIFDENLEWRINRVNMRVFIVFIEPLK